MSGEYDAYEPDEFDDLDPDYEPADGTLDYLTDDELAVALDELDELDGPSDPLDGYDTPVTRRCKPDATGRSMHDVLRTL